MSPPPSPLQPLLNFGWEMRSGCLGRGGLVRAPLPAGRLRGPTSCPPCRCRTPGEALVSPRCCGPAGCVIAAFRVPSPGRVREQSLCRKLRTAFGEVGASPKGRFYATETGTLGRPRPSPPAPTCLPRIERCRGVCRAGVFSPRPRKLRPSCAKEFALLRPVVVLLVLFLTSYQVV